MYVHTSLPYILNFMYAYMMLWCLLRLPHPPWQQTKEECWLDLKLVACKKPGPYQHGSINLQASREVRLIIIELFFLQHLSQGIDLVLCEVRENVARVQEGARLLKANATRMAAILRLGSAKQK